jgi:hypothetical protein
MKKQMLCACLAITVVAGLFVGSVGVANAQQLLPEGYKPDLAKPDRENKDVKADVQWLADREKIRNTVLSYSHLFDERNFDEWKKL